MRVAATLLIGLGYISLVQNIASAETKPVKIGVLTDMSGPVSNFSGKGSVVSAQLAIEDFGGKVLGRDIELIFADHQNKADIASAIARRWYEAEGVDAILDVAVSSAGLAVMGVSRTLKKPVFLSTSATSEANGKACSPYAGQWAFDTYALAKAAAQALVKEGASKWFFITSDYAFGHSLEADLTAFIKEAGGQVVDRVRHPLGTSDFASYLVRAQSSGADVVVFANSAQDLTNSIKQAHEFGLVASGKRLAVPLISIPQLHALGADAIQGVVTTNAFVWNRNEETTAWSQRFFAKMNAMPADTQAANYSSLLHYLKAVKAVGSTDGDAVMEQMRKTPVQDMFARDGQLRMNGSMVHDIISFKQKPGRK